jgi:carboxy-terminal domain RNA polymerase II polypeptide A small phosphatase
LSKKLLILDLDETLIHTETQYDRNPLQDLYEVGTYDFKFSSSDGECQYYVTKRPHLKEFLDWAFENFKVAVWTAAGDVYAKNVLGGVGLDWRILEFFYTRENCTIKLDYELNHYYGIKNLTKLRKKYNLDEVLIVDDVANTAVNNFGNLVLIKPFTSDRNDSELLKLKNYLEKIKDAKNFRSIEKRGWANN